MIRHSRFFRIASWLSLLLCVATTGLWVRSYFISDGIYYLGRHLIDVTDGLGRLTIAVRSCSSGWEYAGDWQYVKHEPTDQFIDRGGLVTEVEHSDWVTTHVLSFPLWPVAAFASLLPLGWGLSVWQRQDSKHHCATCQYNLTGNTSGVCPECGKPVSQKSGTIA